MKFVCGFTGHEEVWHGSIDIILLSSGGIPETAASYFDDSQGLVAVASHINGLIGVLIFLKKFLLNTSKDYNFDIIWLLAIPKLSTQ